MTEEKSKNNNEEFEQYVLFQIDREEYGVKLIDLKEIIKIPELTPLPNAPEYFAGIFNLRGKIIPVIDLEKRFSLKRETSNFAEHILISEQNGELYGIIVDRVPGTIKISPNQIQKPQSSGIVKINEAYIEGIATIGDTDENRKLIIILNINKILSPSELAEFNKAKVADAKK